jgi:hypothetical protein
MLHRKLAGWVYVNAQGRRVGPVSGEELKQALARGEVKPWDRVWMQWEGPEATLTPVIARYVYGKKNSS